MSGDLQRLLQCLRTGGAAVVHVREEDGKIGLFTHGGHYVAVIGEEPDGRVAVLDPSYKEGKYEEEGRKGKVEMKNGVIALCTPEVLDEDATHSRDVCYYLFWRK
jgi:archaeosine-15-forming tRNA-guanine transglycosylase